MHIEDVNIMDVIEKNGIHLTGRSGLSYRGTCPFCGGKSTFSVTPAKGLFQCFLCEAGGDKVKLEYLCNPQEYGNGNFPLFLKNMEEYLHTGTETSSAPTQRYRMSTSDENEDTYRASAEYCSAVYRSMLSALSLKAKHRKDLKNRGLSDEQIDKWLIRSAPEYKERYKIPQILMKKGFNLEGVPGFYMEDNGRWAVKNYLGYLCPVFDGNRKLVTGFQVRLDKPIDGNKYIWFSSTGCKGGSSSGCLSSFLPGEYDRTAIIVEGTLKGLITYLLLNKKITVITVPGVGSIRCLKEILSALEGWKLFICYDMDEFPTSKTMDEAEKKKTERIKKATEKLEAMCEEFNITTHRLRWNISDGLWNGEGKGVDDFLLTYPHPEKFSEYIISENETFLKLCAVLKQTN